MTAVTLAKMFSLDENVTVVKAKCLTEGMRVYPQDASWGAKYFQGMWAEVLHIHDNHDTQLRQISFARGNDTRMDSLPSDPDRLWWVRIDSMPSPDAATIITSTPPSGSLNSSDSSEKAVGAMCTHRRPLFTYRR